MDAEEFFDPESVRWYRRVFDERHPGRHQALSDVEFLNELGFVVEQGERLVPTRAAVLIFGRPRHVRRILPRPVVDCQFIDSTSDSWTTDRRWADRIVVEENLIQAWLTLFARYKQHATHPFGVDAATLRRDDGDHGRKASIRFFRDQTGFWNPGDAFATTDELLDPTEKEVRNPAIVTAFRRIGLSEQAGTGVRAIFRGWQRLGYVPPLINSDKARKAFELLLLREQLLSEEQQLLQVQLGVKLSETEARLFAFACRQGGASLTDAKAVTGQPGPEARKVLNTVVVQRLLEPIGESDRYGLAEHLKDSFGAAQPGQSTSDQARGGSKRMVSDQPGRAGGWSQVGH